MFREVVTYIELLFIPKSEITACSERTIQYMHIFRVDVLLIPRFAYTNRVRTVCTLKTLQSDRRQVGDATLTYCFNILNYRIVTYRYYKFDI